MNVRRRPLALPSVVLLALGAAACSQGSSSSHLPGMTAQSHAAFPVAAGAHAADCSACHTSATTFSQFSCTGCHAHDQGPIDLVHNSVTGYAPTSAACYRCHAVPTPQTFSHTGITGSCAYCHDVGASFAALPKAGFTHADTRGADCAGCHGTGTWASAAAPPGLVRDPMRDLTVTGNVPAFAATTIVRLSPMAQALPMFMDHATTAIPSDQLSSCGACHADPGGGSFYPGELHSSLANQGWSQPTVCAGCHAAAAPDGFVGPTATQPARSPPSGEMRHEAVAWSGGMATSTRLVTADCGVCHASPSAAVQATWATGVSGTPAPTFHAALTAAAQAQPGSCLDCHANSRPTAVLTSPAAAVPAGLSFDHGVDAALGDCAACHAAGGFGAWSGGRFHLAGSATPSTCLPCHAGERPTSTAGWRSTTYTASPFDYVTNAAGITHGDGLDCAECHRGPGTGAWGGTQNWVGGGFSHATAGVAGTTCIACHMSQRPDLVLGAAQANALLGFDHAVNGTGDCFGCHQATVRAGRFVDFWRPGTQTLPGGDWKGGEAYPGAVLVSSGTQFISLTEITLVRSGATGLVTSMSTATATHYNAMLHTSTTVPASMAPGAGASVDYGVCWRCHTSTGTTVTSYVDGKFHAVLTAAGLPQPTAQCKDCHAQMRPVGRIVEGGGSSLVPMDHSTAFSAPTSIGGVIAAGVADLDCSQCHRDPGGSWSGGVFHANIATARPADCVACHYPLMASAAADVTSGTAFAMKHGSAQLTSQRCDTCHASALAQSKTTPAAAALWRTGVYHASVSPQPSGCVDCHAGSDPGSPTQSTVTYVLAGGGTSTNGAQWMSHAASGVVSRDCAACHAADAGAAAWSRSARFHAAVASPGACQPCHGQNGGAPGTNNNLPAGLTSSATLTTASGNASTGVPAGTRDQITHADVNVSGHDCGFCHTQAGPSTAAGVAGHEWAQARFHASFSASSPLVLNGTTGRCSNCHMNVKPGASFTAFDHSGITATGSQDCSACHSWPGTGGAASPNWLGAAGAPQVIAVGGFTVSRPPAANTTTIQAGIANLPHPSTASTACTVCHASGSGGKNAKGYDHASTLMNGKCSACHEAGSNLVGTAWNGATTQAAGLGDTRPTTLPTLVANRGGDTCNLAVPNHFYPVDCYQCHNAPAGNGLTTTGTAYTSAWRFPHTNSRMSNPATCNLCHNLPNCSK